jgi:hypothetical protein
MEIIYGKNSNIFILNMNLFRFFQKLDLILH